MPKSHGDVDPLPDRTHPIDAEPTSLSRPQQRAHPRVPLDVEVSLSSDSHFYAGLSGDISQGGLFVATYMPLKPGDSVLLRFTLPDQPIEVEGVVRWLRPATEHSPSGAGVSFRELPSSTRASIQAFCKERAALYYDVDE